MTPTPARDAIPKGWSLKQISGGAILVNGPDGKCWHCIGAADVRAATPFTDQSSDAAQGDAFEFGGYCGTCGSPCDEQGRSIHGHNGSQPAQVDEVKELREAMSDLYDAYADMRVPRNERDYHRAAVLRARNALRAHKGEGNG